MFSIGNSIIKIDFTTVNLPVIKSASFEVLVDFTCQRI